jgi:predicted transcriptional regulator
MPDTARQFQSMVSGLASLGLTRREIAKQADISAMTVQRGIVGDVREPSATTFQKVQRAWEAAGKPVAK